jgi:hypothetical protein
MKAKRLRRGLLIVAALVGALVVAALASPQARRVVGWAWRKVRGGYTVEERVAAYRADVEARLRPHFAAAKLPYPPQGLAYVAFKDARRLEVYGRAAPDQPWAFVIAYPVLGASGGLGPKLREGDKQVPEGVYAVESLNPNSKFHLSLRLSYPNGFDREMATADGRDALGGDIMIHGSDASIGCLAMGDEAAEDLFVLAALVGASGVEVIISPTDLRAPSARAPADGPPWAPTLYSALLSALARFPSPIRHDL